MTGNYLIVGGSTGIGRALAESLLRDGNRVWVASRSALERMEPTVGLSANNVDATDPAANWSFLPDTLHGVAYCAGSINLKPFHRLKAEDFLGDFQVNLMGAVHTIQAALPALKASGNGSIVLFSSVAASRGLTFHASVSAAKGAVEGLVRALSAELAPAVRINAVALSLSNTPMAEKLLNSDGKQEAARNRHPLKRFGTPHDGAAAARFLLSGESSWITGQVLGVDGGMHTVQNV
jgi:NAD(P)-dependent dehydrogenase (short-subunit alcohol dehydrogenase family)